jgi:hypothetical protein
MNESRTITIRSEVDVITARMHVREVARAAGMNLGDQARISLATSSLAHALGIGGRTQGQITIDRTSSGGRTGVRVVCVEKDGALDNLTPGVFGDTRWMVDEMAIEALPSDDPQVARGVQVTVIKWLA